MKGKTLNYVRYELGKKIESISEDECDNIIKELENKKDETYIIVRDKLRNKTMYIITKQDVEEAIEVFRAAGMDEKEFTFRYRGTYVLGNKDKKKYGVKRVTRRIIETKYDNTTPVFETPTAEAMLERLDFKVDKETPQFQKFQS